MKTWLILLMVFGFGSFAHAYQTRVYGMDHFASVMAVPQSICVYPGQVLRLRADVVSPQGFRYNAPAERFIWRLTRSNGFWQQWDASVSFGYGPFIRGVEPESVYVTVPFDIGYFGRLEFISPGAQVGMIMVRDAENASSLNCSFAYADVYVDGEGSPAIPCDPPQPPGKPCEPPQPPSPTQGFKCFGQCTVDFQCTDGCPMGAQCLPVAGALVPTVKVRSCGFVH